MVVRHGSRYPSTKQAKRSIEFLENLRKKSVNKTHVLSFLNEIDGDAFKDKPHYGLTDVGGQEQREIGSRFRQRYLDLIKSTSLNDVSFISSSKPRSIESGGNFTNNLFLDQFTMNNNYQSILNINDELMRGFDECKVYVKKVQESLNANKEYHFFKESEIVKSLLDEFRKRHFIDNNYHLDIGMICNSLIFK